MKIQISRNSKQAKKNYSSVCHQQGRMLTDSDLTEQALISRDRLDKALKDVIGSGAPRYDALLRVAEDGTPGLFWGRVYVDGVAAEVKVGNSEADPIIFDYSQQHNYLEAPALPDTKFRYYVDVWERVITWLDDKKLRDPGLYGADTTTRTQTVAQVKWCAEDLDPLCDDINPTIGNARLRLQLRSLASSADPCDPCADELELNEAIGNYLFRVEVHDVHYDDDNRPDSVVLKWSSENGAEAYKTSDLPPDFSSNQYVYEYFDELTEQRLGIHLARDVTNERIIDGIRPAISNTFSATSSEAKDFVRRWDGWCQISKTDTDWELIAGFEGSIDLTSGVGAGKPGHVEQGGDLVKIELRVITKVIELADLNMMPGDYWTVPVRESVHQQGEILLEGEEAGKGATPEGEPHHYMMLVDVDNNEAKTMRLPSDSNCDDYNACQLPQFPSLTDLRADDICYDNQQCNMTDVKNVQGALDYLCQQNDLPWHNKHLHGWGIVCGLALECNKKHPERITLQSGYALDCEGRDVIIKQKVDINVIELIEKSGIKPQELDRNKGQGVCLYLDTDENNQTTIKAEKYNSEETDWTDIFTDTLLMDFFQDCILDLIAVIKDDMRDDNVKARCAITKCGKELVEPVDRRMLALINMFISASANLEDTVLNVSSCEHALLKDLYDRLKGHVSSKTFCAQFKNNDFPEYPFDKSKLCRSTWFTPDNFDHIALSENGKYVFGWQRNSSKIYIFKQLEKKCIGDVIGYMDIPNVQDGTITDLIVNEKNEMYLSAIIHKEDTVILNSVFNEEKLKKCKFGLNWRHSFICGVKITNLEFSPWSGQHIFAVVLCKGIYKFDIANLFENEKIEKEPEWGFPASGHIRFDAANHLIIATAYQGISRISANSCATGYYDSIAVVRTKEVDQRVAVIMMRLMLNDAFVEGNDGFDFIGSAGEAKAQLKAFAAINLQPIGMSLYVVINENDNKILCMFNSARINTNENKQLIWEGTRYHSFERAIKVDVQYISEGKTDGILASRFAMHDLQFIPGNPKNYKTGLIEDIPVQLGPVNIITNNKRKQVYVLNFAGQSITVLNYEFAKYRNEREILKQYRSDVIDAYLKLFSAVLQYIKDCFCHHLLVSCPECDEDDKLYLGCLSVEDNQVYHICNFTKRKYVKTFPTLSYWLSLIPIEGMISWVVEKLCCVPAYDSQKTPARGMLSAAQLGMAKSAISADQSNVLSTLATKGGKMLSDGMTELVGSGYKNKSAFLDVSTFDYQYRRGVFVEPKPVDLSNQVLYDKMEVLSQQRINNTQNVDQLNTDIKTLQQEKTVVEQRFATIDTEKQAAETKVSLLEKEITELRLDKVNTDKRMVELQNGMTTLEIMRKEMQPIIDAAKPVSSIAGISAKNITLLEENNIRTVGSLAIAKPEALIELGIQSKTATSLLNKAIGKISIK